MLLFHVAREQGELAPDLADVPLEPQRTNLHGLVMIALAQIDHGELSGPLEELGTAATEDPTAAGEPAWPAYLAVLAEAAATAADPTHAEFLAAQLAPFEGLLLSMPTGLATLGAADRYLGMLSALLGHWNDAEVRFQQALRLERHVRGWALLPRTRYSARAVPPSPR